MYRGTSFQTPFALRGLQLIDKLASGLDRVPDWCFSYLGNGPRGTSEASSSAYKLPKTGRHETESSPAAQQKYGKQHCYHPCRETNRAEQSIGSKRRRDGFFTARL